jgi:hypothetical protein
MINGLLLCTLRCHQQPSSTLQPPHTVFQQGVNKAWMQVTTTAGKSLCFRVHSHMLCTGSDQHDTHCTHAPYALYSVNSSSDSPPALQHLHSSGSSYCVCTLSLRLLLLLLRSDQQCEVQPHSSLYAHCCCAPPVAGTRYHCLQRQAASVSPLQQRSSTCCAAT